MRLRHLAPLGALLILPLGLITGGCPGDPEPPPQPPPTPDGGPTGCKLEPLGDPTAPIEFEIIALDPEYQAYPVSDGDVVHNLFPPQGGRVIFAGVRATNLDPCAVQLAGAIRDPVSQQARPESRTTNLKPLGDGWGASIESDISTFSNIPTCPNQWSSRDLYDAPYELTVQITERTGRTASKTVQVVPVCEEAGLIDDCRCMCKGGYVLGEACAPGSGSGGGSGGAGGADGAGGG
ncbi:hypothetical protein [Chondromyces crocatus]|uniref:Secreted protein n=1 Tax=Chondromyces crocatus TaxID=52 RepID=A0A0K1E5B8_CHOCO|nr:hypothetical protein [Chondromyces crocatus]AKT36049.1 uncharacterized protein CMC5_001610 [Chondromyces crocatus]